MNNIKTALAIALVFFGLPILWIIFSYATTTAVNWLAFAGYDWLIGSLIIATILWLYIRIVAKLWR